VIVEYKMNIETAQKLNGFPLSFNNAIQFLHLGSNKFLTCNYNEAQIEKENFSLELEEFPSARSCFRLLPAFQHQFAQEAYTIHCI
jgi:Inositol 1,4,5-trisphosphate/ryanodine receptor